MQSKIYLNKKLIFLPLLYIILFLSNLYAIENKIVLKINNEIVTSLDIKNEIQYLKSLNPSINLLSLIIKNGRFINFPSFDNSSIISFLLKSRILKFSVLKLLPLVLKIFFISNENCIKASSKNFFEGGNLTISLNS